MPMTTVMPSCSSRVRVAVNMTFPSFTSGMHDASVDPYRPVKQAVWMDASVVVVMPAGRESVNELCSMDTGHSLPVTFQ